MIKVSLTDNFNALEMALIQLEQEQMPYATARALTDMAKLGQAVITRDIPQLFGQGGPPKPFTIASVVAKSATKDNLAAMVFIKDKQAAYLALEETGGTRQPKGRALLLPGSERAELHDVHGNIPEGLLRKLRSAARKTSKNAAVASKRAKAALARASRKAPGAGVRPAVTDRLAGTGIVYFSGAGPHGRGTAGFYERDGAHIRRLVGFESASHYKPIFKYHERIQAVVGPAFASALIRRLIEAQSSRR
jgi:hypothetical protein